MLKILGMGNLLRGDDAIGSIIISELEKKILPLPVELIDIGSDVFSLLQHLVNNDPMLIIDCAKMGKLPGQVIKFNIEDTDFKNKDEAITLHGFSFAEIYKMAGMLGRNAKTDIIGIEPGSLAFNNQLSKEVNQSIPLIIQMVIEEIKKYAQKNINH